jgi:hypothetical protein
MLEVSRHDAAALHEVGQVLLLDPDHPPEAVGQQLTLVDEPIERPEIDPELLARLRDFFGCLLTRSVNSPFFLNELSKSGVISF